MVEQGDGADNSTGTWGFTEPRARLLDWYDTARRDLPWRVPPTETPDAYAVWVSEIMLQQTRAATVIPYYTAFLARWPTIDRLATAPLDAVLHAWQGLGYYHRARSLHACARVVTTEHGGRFPTDPILLRALPGIGAYTAAAISAIAFGAPVVPVDGNVLRVLARFHGIEQPLPQAKGRITALAERLNGADRPGDLAQALMDLGATVCLPKRPLCGSCPWQDGCVARATGTAEVLPRRLPRPVKPVRYAVVFWARRPDGRVLLRRRPDRGLLPGMMEFPSTEWRTQAWTAAEAAKQAPLEARWESVRGTVRHVFSHFALELTLLAATTGAPAKQGAWYPIEDFSALAMPSLMRKVARHALMPGSRTGTTI